MTLSPFSLRKQPRPVLSRPTNSQFSFAFRRVLPPRLLRLAFHEPDGGDEHVQHAGIVALARDAAEVVVQRIRPITWAAAPGISHSARIIGFDSNTQRGHRRRIQKGAIGAIVGTQTGWLAVEVDLQFSSGPINHEPLGLSQALDEFLARFGNRLAMVV